MLWMATGTTDAPASIESTKAPFLNGNRSPAGAMPPSAKTARRSGSLPLPPLPLDSANAASWRYACVVS